MVVMLAIILLILSSTSCSRMLGQNNNKQQGQNEQQQQKKDLPSALTEMEKETDNMIQQIQKIRDQRAQMVRQQTSASQKHNGGNKSQQEQQKSNQRPQKQGQQKQGQQKQQKSQNQDVQQTQLTINWQDFEKRIKALNELWNSYEPQAKKDGAPDVLISQFEKQLNTLTSTIMARNEEETLVAANGLYQYYPQFFNLYRHKAPPEIKEIKYYLQEIVINAEAGKWEDAAALLENMEKAWQTAKSRMQKPDHELNERIDHAMQDFSQVVKQKDLQLVKIKGEILLKNVEKVK
ncbi:hypothetical protein [Caldicoprobacter algeriensis]|uniref:hypothetical protein n=1 Tax=Caldicoprobacter algeriensis TaxID=699281 RepID=UPI00207ABA27|nr:hypothetical protein [Caldicoprobacter algeriensis]